MAFYWLILFWPEPCAISTRTPLITNTPKPWPMKIIGIFNSFESPWQRPTLLAATIMFLNFGYIAYCVPCVQSLETLLREFFRSAKLWEQLLL